MPNAYIRDLLQHRAYREIQRIVAEVEGQPVELCFEVPYTPSEERTVPLFKLLIEAEQAEQEFYRNWKGVNHG